VPLQISLFALFGPTRINCHDLQVVDRYISRDSSDFGPILNGVKTPHVFYAFVFHELKLVEIKCASFPK
jgi:hypothetical protein